MPLLLSRRGPQEVPFDEGKSEDQGFHKGRDGKGFTTEALVDLARTMEAEAACRKVPGKSVPAGLVDEYIVRTGDPKIVIKHQARLSDPRLLEAVRWAWALWESIRSQGLTWSAAGRMGSGQCRAYWLFRTAAEEFDAGRPLPPGDGLLELATVASVMLS